MQFKSALVVSTAVFVAVMGSYGCSSSPAKTDGGTDAKADALVHPDTGTTGDGGGTCTSGLACELCDVSGYTPTTQSKPTVMKGACTAQQITDFGTACFGTSATQTTCNNWQTANADAGSCVSCVFTLQSAAAWGALVCTSTSCSLNSPGCLDIELNQIAQEKQAGGTGSCGDILSDSYGCQDYACGTCSTTGSPSDFSTCTTAALNAECKSYGDKFSTDPACASLQGDAAPAGAMNCFPQADTDVPNFVNVFCGTGP